MKFKGNSWICVTGKAGQGKTYFIRAHIRKIPPSKLFILDFNCMDYQDFLPDANLWNVRAASKAEIDSFLKAVYKHGNAFTVLEEADNYLRKPSEIASRFVNTARNRNIGAFVNVKRPKAIPPEYRTRFNYLVCFKNTLPDDIDYLEDWTGTGKGSLECLNNLETGEHIIINLDTQEVSGVMPPI